MIGLCIFSLLSLSASAAKLNGYGLHMDTLDNLVFNDQFFITEKYPVGTVTACAVLCWNDVDCMSFSVNKNMEKCRIYQTAFYRAEDGTVDQGWRYYKLGSAKCPLRAGFIHSRRNNLCINVVIENTYLYEGGKQHCLDKGSNLITLEKAEKVNAFKDTMSSCKYSGTFTIGLTYSGGKWRWEDGTVLGSEAYWGDNRPRASNYCAHVIKSWEYKYEDRSCYAYPNQIICERKLDQ